MVERPDETGVIEEWQDEKGGKRQEEINIGSVENGETKLHNEMKMREKNCIEKGAQEGKSCHVILVQENNAKIYGKHMMIWWNDRKRKVEM
jgi:hypothetical protein